MATTYSPATRDEVYAAIDSERAYQNSLGADRREPREINHSVGDYLTMLRVYLNKADVAWTDNPGTDAAMNVIRKIAGIAVRAMEEHGAPQREGYETTPSTLQIWYGPHPCENCGEMIAKLSREQGGAEVAYPTGLIYPNTQWEPHQCPLV